MPTILTDADLVSLGNLIQAIAMKDTCIIWRNPDQVASTSVPDGQGGFTGAATSSVVGWKSVATLPCAVVEPMATKGAEPYQAGQLQSKSVKIILLPRLTDVRDSDRLQVGSVYYEVIEVTEPLTYEVQRRVYAERQGQGAN